MRKLGQRDRLQIPHSSSPNTRSTCLHKLSLSPPSLHPLFSRGTGTWSFVFQDPVGFLIVVCFLHYSLMLSVSLFHIHLNLPLTTHKHSCILTKSCNIRKDHWIIFKTEEDQTWHVFIYHVHDTWHHTTLANKDSLRTFNIHRTIMLHKRFFAVEKGSIDYKKVMKNLVFRNLWLKGSLVGPRYGSMPLLQRTLWSPSQLWCSKTATLHVVKPTVWISLCQLPLWV